MTGTFSSCYFCEVFYMPPNADNSSGKRDVTLSPNQYALVQDQQSGQIKVANGPQFVNLGPNERFMKYQHKKGSFVEAKLEEAAHLGPVAPEGYYLTLFNPSMDAKGGLTQPDSQKNSLPRADQLIVGRKINIQGPFGPFALWPGQHAEVTRGHRFRSNQFLLVQIYDAEAASQNWQSTKIQAGLHTPAVEGKSESTDFTKAPGDLAPGQFFLIKGTDESFYIPPTGVQVVPESEIGGVKQYVREALTLERLEYCVLVEESGTKRYEIGPKVVFPSPTETFRLNPDAKPEKGEDPRKSRAIEMTNQMSIHIRVIAPYKEGEKEFKVGQEFIVLGKDHPIYFPREEHAISRYDGSARQYAVTIPKGEGRYLLERETGNIKMVRGPIAYLANPIMEIFVRRALSDDQCRMWYPNNNFVLEYNQSLRELAKNTPSTRSGAVTEGEVSRSKALRSRGGGGLESMDIGGSAAPVAAASPAGAYLSSSISNSSRMMDQSGANLSTKALIGDVSEQASTYSDPKTMTIDSKFKGAPAVAPWSNFAVQIVSSDGTKKVIQGSKKALLDWDEELEILHLSTGTPKNMDRPLRTPYLQISSNKVSDRIEVVTLDHVFIDLKYSLLVNFEGDSSKWFSVSNYVKLLTDHVRSVLKTVAKKSNVRDFFTNATEIIRDTVLGKTPETGKGRPGMTFEQNGMRVADVDVLEVNIKDPTISNLLNQQAVLLVKQDIELVQATAALATLKKKEEIDQQKVAVQTQTIEKNNLLLKAQSDSNTALELAQGANVQKKLETDQVTATERQELANISSDADLDRYKKQKDQELIFERAALELEIHRIEAETEAAVEKAKAFSEGFTQTVAQLHNQGTLEKVTQALSVSRSLFGEDNFGEFVKKLLSEGGAIKNMLEVSMDKMNSNGASSKLPQPRV